MYSANPRRAEDWNKGLPFLDTYRTTCIAPEPDVQRLLMFDRLDRRAARRLPTATPSSPRDPRRSSGRSFESFWRLRRSGRPDARRIRRPARGRALRLGSSSGILSSGIPLCSSQDFARVPPEFRRELAFANSWPFHFHHCGVKWCGLMPKSSRTRLDDTAESGSTRVSITVPNSDYNELRLVAKDKRVSVAWVVREAVTHYLRIRSPLFPR